jgi:hypothetical protein
LALVVTAVATASALSGCGSGGGHGTATVWVTRDRGAHVLLVRHIPAGLTAMQGLDRVAGVKTRYAGRYVQAIDGIEGSLSARRDWFYFINGYEADRSAAEYRLHAGDVEWWDFRSWQGTLRQPVVVGAFPEPFLHGYDGRRRPAVVRYVGDAGAAQALGRLIHARSVAVAGTSTPRDANVLYVGPGLAPTRFRARLANTGGAPGAPVRFLFLGDARQLTQRPRSFRFRYSVP